VHPGLGPAADAIVVARFSQMRFDPPLRHRLLWRDPLSPDTLLSEDRGLMARTFGTLALLGAALGVIVLIVHAKPRDYTLVWIVIGLELFIATSCFIGYRRLPLAFFRFALLVATAGVCLSALAEPVAGQGVMALYILWIVLMAGLFFGPRAAVLYAVIATASYSAILFSTDNPFAPNYAVGTLAVMCAAGVVVGLLSERLQELAARLGRDARTDAVTGLANRRGFDERFDLEVARTARDGLPVSVVVCDLDHFKRVNDELGHDRGDAALRTAAWAIRSAVRVVDGVGRLGGEEFGVILPGADEEEAMTVADRVCESVRVAFDGHPVQITVSCGVATVTNGGPRDRLLLMADEAMYEAKRRGRDRAVAAPPAESPARGGPRPALVPG
jgi:diguanylate cyclase (GGDEF)-like protein